MTKPIYSRLNWKKPNNLEIAKPRVKEDRHEKTKYRSITLIKKNKKFPNKILKIQGSFRC